ncbi:MAG: DUF1015 domain-containing protein [Actinomycetota bacterium]|nr:DUF1015 domain-containing protein [Actinomycetota bacterium]
MAQIKALRGIHYNQARVDLDDVTTPPYDIISPEAQEGYYRRSPFNIIRLDLGKVYTTDDAHNNRYTRAAADFADWQSQNILVRDKLPAVYAYRQTHTANDRRIEVTGIICLVKLEEFGAGVMPHEKTLSGPKEDRRRLLEACRANFSQVFALFADATGTVKQALRVATTGLPAQSSVDEDGVAHQLWPVTELDKIGLIAGALAPKRLLIADGHHRYETSLNFAKAARASGDTTQGFDYIMMYLVDMANETLTVLPTHRLVNLDDFSLDDFIAQVTPTFKVTVVDTGDLWQPDGHTDTVSFGVYAQGRRLKLEADKRRLIDSVQGTHAEQWKGLDTALLQEILLGPIFGISSGDQRLSFTQDAAEAKTRVDSGNATLAMLLRPTGIDQITAVAEAGEKMPQKSTYFWPKPRTGLIVNKLD